MERDVDYGFISSAHIKQLRYRFYNEFKKSNPKLVELMKTDQFLNQDKQIILNVSV